MSGSDGDSKLGWQQQVLRMDRIELLRSREAMGTEVDAALGWIANQPRLKREDHLSNGKNTFSWRKASGAIQRRITIGLLTLWERQMSIVVG